MAKPAVGAPNAGVKEVLGTLYCTSYEDSSLLYKSPASGKRYVQVCTEMYGTVDSRLHKGGIRRRPQVRRPSG